MEKENEEVVEKEVEEVVEEEETKEEEVKTETPEVEEDTTDWKAKAEEEEGRRKRAETKLSKKTEKKSEKAPSKSNDLDYGAKAFLASHDLKVKGAKEYEFVQKELDKSGENLDTLLENEYFIERLEKFRAIEKTSEATPQGKRSGGVATDSVEYWMTKDSKDIPKNMRTKVVNARLEKETKKGVFYNS